MKTTFLILLFAFTTLSAQVPIATHVQILKAEDSRSYDAKLEALLKSPNAEVRARAALAAGRIGDPAAVPGLAALAESSVASDAEMAAFAIGEIEAIQSAEIVYRGILRWGEETAQGTSRGAVHARFVEAAGKIVAANITDPRSKDLGRKILDSLEGELKRDSAASKETILLALTAALRARPENGDVTVRKFLAFTDPDIVATALNTLARLRAKNANKDARDLLETNTHAIVRANAARLLGAAEDKESVDVLIKAATKDIDSRVRVSAIRSLATLKDAKPAVPLLVRGEELFARYKAEKKPDYMPSELSEFIEIATALGRILQFSRNERAVKLLREFGKIDKGISTEVYIAGVRISPEPGDGGERPELTDWRQYRTLAQMAGEIASMELADSDFKAFQAAGVEPIRALAKAFAEADPAAEGKNMLAAPDALQAFAKFKTDDLGEIARLAVKNPDVFLRAEAANILADLPTSEENVNALKSAFARSLITDKHDNDVQLAILNALYKLDKKAAVGSLMLALSATDYLVRKNAFDKLDTEEMKKDAPGIQVALDGAREKNRHRVLPYAPAMGTKLGQVLNTDSDYRRALTRKNGSISAVFTTQKGSFTINFLPEYAPLTVDNFVKLARTGYFNGLEVHRVVPNFVMQDGDPLGNGSGGPGWSIRCEVNMVPYDRGAVGMALSGKDTGGSQWFVTHSPQPHLDGGYTVFGRVNETGMKVVDKIVRGDKIVSVRIVGR